MKKSTFVSAISLLSVSALGCSQARAGQEGMPSMPVITDKSVTTVKNKDQADEQKGFGDRAPMVRMMNLMMVEGSGMEGMKMGDMPATDDKKTTHVKMEAMERGSMTASAKPTETASQQKKQQRSSNSDFIVAVTSATSPVRAGSNTIKISILDSKSKKMVGGLKLQAKVYMTSMDMGTEEPEVSETSPGTYELKAPFAMKGPWAVKLIFPDKTDEIFNFDVQSSK